MSHSESLVERFVHRLDSNALVELGHLVIAPNEPRKSEVSTWSASFIVEALKSEISGGPHNLTPQLDLSKYNPDELSDPEIREIFFENYEQQRDLIHTLIGHLNLDSLIRVLEVGLPALKQRRSPVAVSFYEGLAKVNEQKHYVEQVLSAVANGAQLDFELLTGSEPSTASENQDGTDTENVPAKVVPQLYVTKAELADVKRVIEHGVLDSESDTARLSLVVKTLLKRYDPEYAERLKASAAMDGISDGWIRSLSDSTLFTLLTKLIPDHYRAVYHWSDQLTRVWSDLSPTESQKGTRELLWKFVFSYLKEVDFEHRSLSTLVSFFFAFLPNETNVTQSRREPLVNELVLRLLSGKGGSALNNLAGVVVRHRHHFVRSFVTGTHQAVQERSEPRVVDRPQRRVESDSSSYETLFGLEQENSAFTDEPIYIKNGGLVMVGPFLPVLFERLDCLSEDTRGETRITDPEKLSEVVHLLQYMVTGSLDTPEHELVLNKLLCGVAPEVPVATSIVKKVHLIEHCESLLAGILQHWSVLSDTSIDGLREGFLQRDARIDRGDDSWTVTVQKKSMDILMEKLPFSFNRIDHKWIAEPVLVNWG